MSQNDLHSSGILRLVIGWLEADISGESGGLIFKSRMSSRRIIQPLMMGPPHCPETLGSSDKTQYRRRQETWPATQRMANYAQVTIVFANRMLTIMGPRQESLEDWENCSVRNFMICTPHQTFLWQNLGRRDIWGHVARMDENTKAFEEFWSENLMERNH
jgi:hypothetical protein